MTQNDVPGVEALLRRYFDGLYRSDAPLLATVFHPHAIYVTTDGTALTYRTMGEYLPIVHARPSPASRGEKRRDAILAIDFAGLNTALAKVQCAIGDKLFTDFLSLIRLQGEWRIISKTFHGGTIQQEA